MDCFWNSKLVEYNLINTEQFIIFIFNNSFDYKIVERIIERIIKNIINFIILQKEKFIELWNKYETLLLSRNIFICMCYDHSKIQEIMKDEILKEKFTSCIIKEIDLRNFNVIKNYLSICKKLELHQDAIYGYVKDRLEYCSIEQLNLACCCYKENNSKFKKIYFEKLVIYYNSKTGKKYFYEFIKKTLTSDDDYDEFIREYLPIVFNYKIIDNIHKKQEELEKKLDLIMKKLDIM